MADLSVVAADVVEVSGVSKTTGIAGAAITAGQPVYRDATDGFKLKPCIDTGAATADAVGIALNSAPGAGQPVTYATSGTIYLGVAAAIGSIYVVSGTAGGIAPETDIGNDDYIKVLGVGDGTNLLMTLTGIAPQKTPSA
jgi:hypothetical protein